MQVQFRRQLSAGLQALTSYSSYSINPDSSLFVLTGVGGPPHAGVPDLWGYRG